MISAPARCGLWLDTDMPCSASVCAEVRARGYEGIIRYVPLPGNRGDLDISALERDNIIAADLQCGLVQHVRYGTWIPSQHSGSRDAEAACEAACGAGYPNGCHLFLDFESMGGTADGAIEFAFAWQETVITAGYRAGLYVGFGVPLSPQQLYDLHGFDCYFSDAAGRSVERRGCAIRQGREVKIAGVTFDEDTVQRDLLGGLPFVASPDSLAA
jgi:Domain of unknown function (DUF1906)